MHFAAIQPEQKWHQTPHWFIASLQPWLPLWRWHEITQWVSATMIHLAHILLHIEVLVPAKTTTLHCLANSFFFSSCVCLRYKTTGSPSSGNVQSPGKTPIPEDDGLAFESVLFHSSSYVRLAFSLFALIGQLDAGAVLVWHNGPTFSKCAHTMTLNRFTLLSFARLKACQWG